MPTLQVWILTTAMKPRILVSSHRSIPKIWKSLLIRCQKLKLQSRICDLALPPKGLSTRARRSTGQRLQWARRSTGQRLQRAQDIPGIRPKSTNTPCPCFQVKQTPEQSTYGAATHWSAPCLKNLKTKPRVMDQTPAPWPGPTWNRKTQPSTMIVIIFWMSDSARR